MATRTTHFSPTFAGKLCYSLSPLVKWISRVIRTIRIKNSPNHDNSWFLSLEMFSDSFRNISWWSGVNTILLVGDHSLHTGRVLVRPNRDFEWGTILLMQQFLPFLPSHFWLEAFESSFRRWILYGLKPKPSFTISLSDLSKIFIFFFYHFLRGFLPCHHLYGFNYSPGIKWTNSS